MSSSFTKTFLNPAKRPEKGFIGFPGVANTMVDLKTNTFTLDRFFFPGLGEDGKTAWFMNEAVGYEQFMNGISNNNYLNYDMDYTPLGFGFYAKELFFSFDLSLRGKSALNIPKSVFDFAKEGFTSEDRDLSYNFSNVSGSALVFTQLGAGVSFPVWDRALVIGVKAKALLGHAFAQFKIDNMHLQLGHDQWNIQSQASLQVACLKAEYDEDGIFSGFDSDEISPINGNGWGLDLGLTFTPGNHFNFTGGSEFLNHFTFSAAVTDLGYITWTKNEYLTTDPNEILITGSAQSTAIENFGDIFEGLGDSIQNIVAFRENSTNKNTTTAIGAKLNAGVEYAVNNRFNIGFLSSTYFNPVQTISEYTLAGAYRPRSGFECGFSYSFVHSRFQTFGLALHFGPSLFIAGDYVIPHISSEPIPLPTTTNAFNLQFGCVIPIGKKHTGK
jgi:hypothetical protein